VHKLAVKNAWPQKNNNNDKFGQKVATIKFEKPVASVCMEKTSSF